VSGPPEPLGDLLAAREAIALAFREFRARVDPGRIAGVRLEGHDLDAPAREWHVLIGFDAGRGGPAAAGPGTLPEGGTAGREFRRITLDAATGRLRRIVPDRP